LSYEILIQLPMDNRANSTDSITRNLSEHDPRTYEIIGAAIEVHKQLVAAFSNRFIKSARN
ncbi:MAG TPA: hypothetical protein VFD75_04965, partial [Pyrinomonadaceae bacterium]|nr:hypothetical protein [Pyrinomonadaceae bacterium]